MREASMHVFVIGAAVVLVSGLGLLQAHGHYGAHLVLNAWHGPLSDTFFRYFTHLADGITVAVIALLFLLHSWRAFLLIGGSAVGSALTTQFLKRSVFHMVDRPLMAISEMPGLRLVEGMEMHRHFSFPSGHTTAAFALCCSIALVTGSRGWAVGGFLLALLLGFSRIHLSQHFLEDVLAGMIVGILWVAVMWKVLYTGTTARNMALDRRPWVR